MSSLSSQLNVISNQSTSTANHTSAIGRGYGYTNNASYSGQQTTEESARFKASILYGDPREAAKYSASQLRESAHSSLLSLGSHHSDPVLTSFANLLCSPNAQNTSRRLMSKPENAKLSESVEKLLLHLLPHTPSPPTLQVLEYLIRRYSVHTYSPTPFLLTLLPCHSTPWFKRALTLVNVAENGTWRFLRPYCRQEAGDVERLELAKQCIKESDFLNEVLNMARKASEVSKDITGREGKPISLTIAPAPNSKVINFVTNLVLTSLSLPTQKPLSDSHLRVLLTYVTSTFTATSTPALLKSGYVVGIKVSRVSVLGRGAKEVMGTALVRGAMEVEKDIEKVGATRSIRALENLTDAMICLIAVFYNDKQDGGELPISTFKALTKSKLLPKAISSLHTKHKLPCLPEFVKSLTMRIAQYLHTKLGERYKKLITILTANPALGGLFTPKLVGEIIVIVLSNYDIQTSSVSPNSNSEDFLTCKVNTEGILDAFGKKMREGVERGVGEIVRGNKGKPNPNLHILISTTLNLPTTPTSSSSLPLPPTVALTSPSPHNRIEALTTLASLLSTNPGQGNYLHSILQTFLTDDSQKVVTMAGKIWLKFATPEDAGVTNELAMEAIDRYSLALSTSTSLYKTKDIIRSKNKQKTLARLVTANEQALRICELVTTPSTSLILKVASHLELPSDTLMPYECGGLHALPPSTLVQLNDAAKFIVQHLADLSLEQIDPKLRSIYCVLFNIKNPGHGLLVSLLKDGDLSDEDMVTLYNHLLPSPTSLSLHTSLALQTSLCTIPLPSSIAPLPNLHHHHLLELATTFKPAEFESADRCLDYTIQTMKSELANKTSAKKGRDKKATASSAPSPDYALPAALSLLTHPERSTRKKSLIFLSLLAPKLSSPLDALATQASSNFALELEMESSAFPGFLGKISLNNEPLKKALLSSITSAFLQHTPLSLSHVSTPTLLLALENAGDGTDDLFPLSLRWELTGNPVFSHFLDLDEEMGWSNPRVNLLKTVVRMMRCVAGDGTGSGLGIVSNGNGRVRKYSVSESSFVKPSASLLDAIEGGLDLKNSNAVTRDLVAGVMKKHSWVDHVFLSLTDERKLSFASLLLKQRVEGEGGSSSLLTQAFENLILGTSQFSVLLENGKGTEEEQLVRLTLLAEYLQSDNGKSAVKGAEGCQIFKVLFNKLYEVASLKNVGGADYCKNTLVECLLSIGPIVSISDEKQQKIKKARRRSSSLNGNTVVKSGGQLETDFHNYSELCIALIEGTGSVSPVVGAAATKKILGLLSVLTDKCPSIAKMLLPALKLVAERDGVDDSRSFQLTTECMQSIIPSFCRSGAKSGLRLFDLISTFVQGYDKILVHRRKSFFSSFIATISSVKKNVGILGSVVASLLAAGNGAEEMRTFVLSLIFSGPTSEQLYAMIKTLEYASELLGDVAGADRVEKANANQGFYHVSHADLVSLIDGNEDEIKKVVCGLLICMRTQLAHPNFPLIVRNTKKAQTMLIETWEKLLRLRSSVADVMDDDDEDEESNFVGPVMSALGDSLLHLQKMLELPTFLVTVKVMVETGGGSFALLRESLLLLGQRVKSVEEGTPEHTLVLEFIPELVSLVKSGEEGVVGVGLNALAITVSNLSGVEKHVKILREGLDVAANLIGKVGGTAVCIESLLSKLKAKALPVLPKMVKAIEVKEVDVVGSLITHLGAFVAKHMDGIVGLVADGAEGLGDIVVEHVQLRLIVPVVAKKISKTGVTLLVKSVEKVGKKEVSTVFEELLELIVNGFEACAKGDSGAVNELTELVLGVVMKQNEKKLRSIARRMEEVKDVKPDGEGVFWKVSLAMASALKSIFINCIQAEDIVERLAGFKNKKRKSGVGLDVGVEVVRVVLLTLSELLKADGFAGGEWVQAEEGRRFRMLLKELSRLLLIDVGISREISACVVSLAAAGGSEMLFKPLNHSILEACNSDRLTVRKVGLETLLNTINTVGEDYLGMLPESLPALGELLEDDDEEVVALARECVQAAEELSGEDLGEYLG